MRRLLVPATLLLLATATTALSQPCDLIRFEGLPLGSAYPSGAVVGLGSSMSMTVGDFHYTVGPCVGPVTSGAARIQNLGDACRAGHEVWVENVTLNFAFGMPAGCIDIHFGYYGGTMSLMINGNCVVVPDVWSLPGALGGVNINVIPAGGGCGVIRLDGVVNSLEIGGQEFFIDDLRTCRGCRLNCPAGDGLVVNTTSGCNKSPDMNSDGIVNLTDFALFASCFLSSCYCVDFDCDGTVGLPDFVLFASHFLHSGVNGDCCR